MATIVIGVDGSDAATKAAEIGASIAKARGDLVVFVCAWTPTTDLGIPDAILMQDRSTRSRERARRVVEDAAAMARAIGVEAETIVGAGHPADEIVRIAEDRGADVIVVGAQAGGRFADSRGGASPQLSCALHAAQAHRPPGTRDEALDEEPGA